MDEAQAQGVCICPCPPLLDAAEPHPPHEQQAGRLPGEVQRGRPGPGHKVEAVEHLRSTTAMRFLPFCCPAWRMHALCRRRVRPPLSDAVKVHLP